MQNKDSIKEMIKDIIQAEDEKDNICMKLREDTLMFSHILYKFFRQKKFVTNDEYFSAAYENRKVFIDYYKVSETNYDKPKFRYVLNVEDMSEMIEVKNIEDLLERLKSYKMCSYYGEDDE